MCVYREVSPCICRLAPLSGVQHRSAASGGQAPCVHKVFMRGDRRAGERDTKQGSAAPDCWARRRAGELAALKESDAAQPCRGVWQGGNASNGDFRLRRGY